MLGCETAQGLVKDTSTALGGLGLDVGGVLGHELGDDWGAEKTKLKEDFAEVLSYQKQARDETQAAYDRLVALLDAQADELETQYVAYTLAVQELREEAGFLGRALGETRGEVDAFIEKANLRVKEEVDNPALQNAARKNIEKFRGVYLEAFDGLGKFHVDFSPLLGRLDEQVVALKTALNQEGLGAVRARLDEVKRETDLTLDKLDAQGQEVQKLIEEIDVVESSLRALNFAG